MTGDCFLVCLYYYYALFLINIMGFVILLDLTYFCDPTIYSLQRIEVVIFKILEYIANLPLATLASGLNG